MPTATAKEELSVAESDINAKWARFTSVSYSSITNYCIKIGYSFKQIPLSRTLSLKFAIANISTHSCTHCLTCTHYITHTNNYHFTYMYLIMSSYVSNRSCVLLESKCTEFFQLIKGLLKVVLCCLHCLWSISMVYRTKLKNTHIY